VHIPAKAKEAKQQKHYNLKQQNPSPKATLQTIPIPIDLQNAQLAILTLHLYPIEKPLQTNR
jgi:hypothetical protein